MLRRFARFCGRWARRPRLARPPGGSTRRAHRPGLTPRGRGLREPLYPPVGCSVTFEDRRTFFNEGACGFLMILGSSRLDLMLRLKIKQLSQASRLGGVEILLHRA